MGVKTSVSHQFGIINQQNGDAIADGVPARRTALTAGTAAVIGHDRFIVVADVIQRGVAGRAAQNLTQPALEDAH